MIRTYPYIIGVILLVSGSCRTKEHPDSIVTATLKGPSAMAMIYMIEEKDSIGDYETEYIVKNEPNQVKAMILEESVEFAVVPSTMAVLLYNKTGKYILAGIPVWGTLYLVGRDTTIHKWSDLKGKKVSLMARGMTPDIMFRFLAERNGINIEHDLQLDYSFPTHIELANAIAANLSPLGVISEPLVSMIMTRNKRVRTLLDFNEEWLQLFGSGVPFAQTALLVKKEFAEKNPGLVIEYLGKLKSSIERVNGNPVKAFHLMVKYEILPDTAVAISSIPRSNLHLSYAGEEMNGIQEYFKVFFNFNPRTLGGKLPDEEFYFKEKPD